MYVATPQQTLQALLAQALESHQAFELQRTLVMDVELLTDYRLKVAVVEWRIPDRLVTSHGGDNYLTLDPRQIKFIRLVCDGVVDVGKTWSDEQWATQHYSLTYSSGMQDLRKRRNEAQRQLLLDDNVASRAQQIAAAMDDNDEELDAEPKRTRLSRKADGTVSVDLGSHGTVEMISPTTSNAVAKVRLTQHEITSVVNFLRDGLTEEALTKKREYKVKQSVDAGGAEADNVVQHGDGNQ